MRGREALLVLVVAVASVQLADHAESVNSRHDITMAESAWQAGLSPAQVVDRVRSHIVETGHPGFYAQDMETIALIGFARAQRRGDLLDHGLALARQRLGNDPVQPFERELFCSLSFELVRAAPSKDRDAAYVEESARYRASVGRAADGAIAFGQAPSRPMLVDQFQEYVTRMARTSAMTGDAGYAREAVGQILLFRNVLRDPATGLWGPARDWPRHWPYRGGPGGLTRTKWGRAQAWVLRGLVETLMAMPPQSREAEMVKPVLRQFGWDLLRFQDADGLWHEVVDEPSSYAETSATGMISYYFARAVVEGDLPEVPFAAAARRAYAGLLQRKVAADGRVFGGVRDTPPQPETDDYRHRMTPMNDLHGVAAVIMSATGQVLLDHRNKEEGNGLAAPLRVPRA
ncbi:glycoside hydrolase family 88 protein [Novosphingobium nitrogenifigens]|uniref:glycoside hydrolase family 88 protein n=1 Tax=Novosphingobium nitrogenifigens TaxID=378548 RepID=UPI000A698CE1|nr:glycoside hydrolase family 88 protein [Novosphingobium nitrogenifigens]